MMDTFDVVIVGGGIAGLTAAYELSTRAPELRYALYEASDRLGGKIWTETIALHSGHAVLEHGPDSVLTQKPWAHELFTELGLDREIVPINSMPSPVRVLHDGRLEPLPAGLSLFVPTDLNAIARSRLFTPLAKARIGLDLVKPAQLDRDDEALGAFVRRRFGAAMLDRIAEPIAAGIYNADPNELSLQATFPRLRALEREHGSVIRGARADKAARATTNPSPPFVALRGGMQMLVEALFPRLMGELHTGESVELVQPNPFGGFTIRTRGGREVRACGLLLAVPTAASAHLLRDVSPPAARALDQLRTRSAGSTSFVFPPGAFTNPLPGFGIIVPASERRPFNAITVATAKFPGRAPEGWTVLRVFFGGARSPQTAALPQERIETVLLVELQRQFGVGGQPFAARTNCWPAGSPRYDVGHLNRVAEIEAALPAGIAVTGSPYRGVGLPDVIRDARRSAGELIAMLHRQPVAISCMLRVN